MDADCTTYRNDNAKDTAELAVWTMRHELAEKKLS